MQQYEKAETYFKEALNLSRLINDQENIANILNNQGLIYQHLGKKELALKLYLEAMQIRKNANNKLGMATSNTLMIEICSWFIK